LAFEIAGRRGKQIVDALEAADQARQKMEDTGPTTFTASVPTKTAARSFDRTGASVGGFAEEANNPEAQDYFQRFADGLMNFNANFG
jgi:hypothetical protein